jgi:hypothetical protein
MLNVVLHAYNASTQKQEDWEIEASLGYVAWFVLQNKIKIASLKTFFTQTSTNNTWNH